MVQEASKLPWLRPRKPHQGETGSRHPQSQCAAASVWKVWPGAASPVRGGLLWVRVIREALGSNLSTTVHMFPASTPLPLCSHLVLSKPNWVLAY